MKFLTKRIPSLGVIILLHIAFSLALMLAWTMIKRGRDFSVTSFSNENFYATGGPEFNIAAVAIGALFKYLHFNHLSFYLFNTLLSVIMVTVFYNLARTGLEKKLSLYITAIFAFNPELAFFNNFVLKENMVIFVMVVAMYFFFRALATNCLTYKILFCLLLPLLALLREPLALMSFLVIAFLPKPKRAIAWVAVVTFGLACIAHGQCVQMAKLYWASHLGDYGITRILLRDIYGTPTVITFGELFSSPALLAEYLFRSILYYIRPGWSAGAAKLNSALVPYTLFVVYVFIASLRYRNYLGLADRRAYLSITLIIVAVSVIFIIYDPIERYRYTVYQFGFMLIILNLRGYQEYLLSRPRTMQTECIATTEPVTP